MGDMMGSHALGKLVREESGDGGLQDKEKEKGQRGEVSIISKNISVLERILSYSQER